MDDYEQCLAEAVALGLMTKEGKATNRCQCTTCDRVFSTDGNFLKHRVGGECHDPATVGLVQDPKGWWKQPGPEESVWA